MDSSTQLGLHEDFLFFHRKKSREQARAACLESRGGKGVVGSTLPLTPGEDASPNVSPSVCRPVPLPGAGQLVSWERADI